MDLVRAHGDLALVRCKLQMVGDVNTPHDQDPAILFDLTNCLGD